MIQQVAFDVPKEIALGLASGEYVQYGGGVRDAAGHIVKHLEPVNVSNDANRAMQVAAQAIQLAKENKKPPSVYSRLRASPPLAAPSTRE